MPCALRSCCHPDTRFRFRTCSCLYFSDVIPDAHTDPCCNQIHACCLFPCLLFVHMPDYAVPGSYPSPGPIPFGCFQPDACAGSGPVSVCTFPFGRNPRCLCRFRTCTWICILCFHTSFWMLCLCLCSYRCLYQTCARVCPYWIDVNEHTELHLTLLPEFSMHLFVYGVRLTRRYHNEIGELRSIQD